MIIDNARCIHHTEEAIVVEADCFDQAEWIPLSQVDGDSEVYKTGTEGDLIIADWFAEKKGWM